MSSGFGTNGGRGRCFPFWQEFAKCHVQSDTLEECKNAFEDYQECLFHKKEVK
jgi:NADH dehydrogenase (ubiquinone) Fe-S protein 5